MKWKLKKDSGFFKRIKDLIDSFYNSKEGMSARKLTAFGLMWMVYNVHQKYVTPENAVEVILIDLGFVLLLLGIITVQNLIELKNGAPQKNDQAHTDNQQN